MGWVGLYLFGEEDSVLVEEIAKHHKLPRDVVEKHYKIMLDNINKDVHSQGNSNETVNKG